MRRSPRRSGFTLIEIMVVVAIIGVASALAIDTLSRSSQREQWRGAVRGLLGLVNEARGQAMLLGNAPGPAGIGRVTDADGDCATGGVDFTVNPGLAINQGTMVAILIDHIIPTFPPGGPGLSRAPTFEIECRTINLRSIYRNGFNFAGVPTWQNDGTNFAITFDGRGMVTGNVAPVSALRVDANPVTNAADRQTILVMGSGQSCLEGTIPNACARTF